MPNVLQRVHGWSVCREYQEYPVPHVEVLATWAELGRLHPDDYLVNTRIETCVQAKEVPELNAIFRRVRRAPLERIFTILGLCF